MNRITVEITIYLILTLLLTTASWIIVPQAGYFMLPASLSFIAAYGIFIYLRTRKIKMLSENLERILHGQDINLSIENSKEGSLSILESEIQKMTRRLSEQSERLKRDKIKLQEAITDIFHQIRTPLTAMNIATSRLAKEDISYETRVLLLRDIKRQIERCRWLTESLLKMSKIDAGTAKFRQETVDVRVLIEKATSPLLIPMELSKIDLIVETGGETFIGDLDWTAEAISNLVKNAIEHFNRISQNLSSLSDIDGQMRKSRDTDSIRNADSIRDSDTNQDCKTRTSYPPKLIRISAEETPLYTQITVEDNGGGFDEADIPRLFERYYKGKYSGADSIGVGLALSRMIIVSQNGSIKACNTADGACFIMKFYKNII